MKMTIILQPEEVVEIVRSHIYDSYKLTRARNFAPNGHSISIAGSISEITCTVLDNSDKIQTDNAKQGSEFNIDGDD